MKEPNFVIYRLWHPRSSRGRIGYIGKDTSYPRRVNLKQRRKNKGCPKLYQALNKYPLSIWKVEVLASGFKTRILLNTAEKFYIRKFDSVRRGYNVLPGGDGGPGWRKGRPISEETKHKLSLINRGKNHPKWGKKDSEETRRKKSLSSQGNKGRLGLLCSKQHKKRVSRALKSLWSGYTAEQRNWRSLRMRLGWEKKKAIAESKS